jgi:hypothetical protein
MVNQVAGALEARLANTRKAETMAQKIELGLDTFGDVTAGPDRQLLPQAQVLVV